MPDIDVTGYDNPATPGVDEGTTNVNGLIVNHPNGGLVSGTGGFQPFLRQNNNDGTTTGFNTSDADTLKDAGDEGLDMDATWTRAIKFGDLPIVIRNGVAYYEIRLDLNEPNNANDDGTGSPNPLLALAEFQLYWSHQQATLDDYAAGSGLVLDSDFHNVYDLDSGGVDRTLILSDGPSGSGNDDYSFLIPVSSFDGAGPDDYLTLFAQFGPHPAEGATFEEFRLQNAYRITGTKFLDVNGDGTRDVNGVDNILGNADDEVGLAGFTMYIDANHNNILDLGEVTAQSGAGGTFTFYNLLAGTYDIREVLTGADVSGAVKAVNPDWDDYLPPAGIWDQTTGNADGDHVVTITTASQTALVGNQLLVPEIHLEKGATIAGGSADVANEVIHYTLAVSNPGDVPLTGIAITDPYADANSIVAVTVQFNGNSYNTGDTDHDNALDLTETWQYTATHTVTQGEIDNNGGGDGVLENTATVTSDQGVSDDDDASVPIDQNPALTIDKVVTDVGGDGADGVIDEAGDVITYDITVTNTGNVTLTNVTITDPLTGGLLHTVASLAPGAHYTQEDVTYTVTQDDLDSNGTLEPDNVAAGLLDNTAVADSDQTDSVDDSEDVPIDQNPALTIDKVVTDVGGDGASGSIDSATDNVTYDITVTNTGNVTLTNVTITDPLTGGLLHTVLSLAPGDSYTLEDVVYDVTQADIDSNGTLEPDDVLAGQLDNTATADSDQTDSVSDSEDVPIIQSPALTIDKVVTDVGGDGADGVIDEAGDVITYDITVTNTGNVTLTNVTITDPLTGGLLHTVASLAPGAHYTQEDVTYTVTQDDLDSNGTLEPDNVAAGLLDNTAVADSDQTDSVDDSEDVPIDQNPAITIVKDGVLHDGGDCVDDADDVIDYTVKVTNTGNVTLEHVVVKDSFEGGADVTIGSPTGDDGNGKLDVGETWTYTYTHDATQADIDSNGGDDDGTLDNVATVTADVIGASTEQVTDNDDESIDVCPAPALTIDKVVTDVGGDGAAGIIDEAGDVITYDITVTNTGNVTLTNVTITDPLTGGLLHTVASLAPGAHYTQEDVTYTVTQDDLDSNGTLEPDNVAAGLLDNTAVADSDQTDSVDDSEDVPIDQNPSVNIEKSVKTDVNGAYVDADDPDGPEASTSSTVDFKVVLTNDGNVTLTDITLSDSVVHTVGGVHQAPVDIDYSDPSLHAFIDLNGDGNMQAGEEWSAFDTDGDGTLDIDENGDPFELSVGETVTIYYSLTSDLGQHENTVEVTTGEGAGDDDDANYFVLASDDCVGVRTPGFWANSKWMTFWDAKGDGWGTAPNEPKQAGTPGFADGELLYKVYLTDSNHDGVINGTPNDGIADDAFSTGLLIGDYNMNGITDVGEDTIFISLPDAIKLINASSKQLVEGKGTADGIFMLGRDMVATWLNYLANNQDDDQTGNCIGDVGGATNTPREFIDAAIDWMQQFASTSNADDTASHSDSNTNTSFHDGNTQATFEFDSAIKPNSAGWQTAVTIGEDIPVSGAAMHAALDGYNNTGAINGVEYCCDADSEIALLAIAQII